MIVDPAPQFRELAEADVLAALRSAEPSAIADEVARLIDGYSANFRSHVARLGRMPASILRAKPRWPIEAIAIRLTTEAIAAELKND